MASFTTDSIIIVHTKARNYNIEGIHIKTAHAKKVVSRIFSCPLTLCKVFDIQIALFLPSEQASCEPVYMLEG
jgi:hypothetical protein